MAFSFPVLTVEVAFVSAPLDPAPTYTAITADVRKIMIRRGANHELAQVQPGNVSLVVNNRADKYNPWNTASPYYNGGNGLVPMKRVRVSAVWLGVTYRLFTGFLESITQLWQDVANSDSQIYAVDGFKVLNLTPISSEEYGAAVAADTPIAWYRLGDKGVPDPINGLITVADSSGNAYDGVAKGSPAFQKNGALPADSNQSVDMGTPSSPRGSGGGWVEIPISTGPSGTGDFSIECLVYPRTFDQSVPSLDRIWHVLNVGSQIVQLILLSDGNLRFQVTDGTNGGYIDTSFPINANTWTHVVAAKISTGLGNPGNWRIYTNAITNIGSGSHIGIAEPNLVSNAALIAGYDISGVEQGAIDGLVDEFAVYNYALDASQVATHYAAAHELTEIWDAGTRISDILDIVGWPAGDRNLDGGDFDMQPPPTPLYTTPALQYMQLLQQSEGYPSIVFITGDGAVTFYSRSHAIPASSGTLGDGPGDLPYTLGNNTAPALDDLSLWTTVIAQRVGGDPQIVSDPTAVTEYVKRTLTFTGLQNYDDADVNTLATDTVAAFKDPKERMPAILLHPTPDNGLYPLVLGLEMFQSLVVERIHFPGGSDTLSLDVQVESVEHSIDLDGPDWNTKLIVAPAAGAFPVPALPLVALGAGAGDETIVTSSDGVTWTVRPSPFDTENSECAGYGNGKWVAGAAGATVIVTSPDGITWTAQTTPFDGGGSVFAVKWIPTLSLWVAAGQDAAITQTIMTSPDGVTWTARACGLDGGIGLCIADDGTGQLLVGGHDATDTNSVVHSTNGTVWNTLTTSMDGFSVQGLATDGAGTWVAAYAPDLSPISGYGVKYTTDLVTWNDITNGGTVHPGPSGAFGVAWHGGLFVVVMPGAGAGAGHRLVMTSADGQTWTYRTTSADSSSNYLLSVAWDSTNSQWVAVGGYNGVTGILQTSPDGVTWTAQSTPFALFNGVAAQ